MTHEIDNNQLDDNPIKDEQNNSRFESKKIISFGSYVPSTFDEWINFCALISRSALCPIAYRGKPEDVFIATQMGADLGLKPMQALQGVAVINSKPCVWGDTALAVVMSHPCFQNIEETIDNDVATCKVVRKGMTPIIRSFSIKDAEVAGLLKKGGVWTTYRNRMLQMRARGFAIRDSFPDALRGLNIAEEVNDYDVSENKPYHNAKKDIVKSMCKDKEDSIHNKNSDDCLYESLMKRIADTPDIHELSALVSDLQLFSGEKYKKDELRYAYREKKKELEISLREMDNDYNDYSYNYNPDEPERQKQ